MLQDRCTPLFCPLGQTPVDDQCVDTMYRYDGLAVSITVQFRTDDDYLVPLEAQKLAKTTLNILLKLFQRCEYDVLSLYLAPNASNTFYIQVQFIMSHVCSVGVLEAGLASMKDRFQKLMPQAKTLEKTKRVRMGLMIVTKINKSFILLGLSITRVEVVYKITSKFYCPYIEETHQSLKAYEQRGISIQEISDAENMAEGTIYRICVADLLIAIRKPMAISKDVALVYGSRTAHGCFVAASLFSIFFSLVFRDRVKVFRPWTCIVSVLLVISQTHPLIEHNWVSHNYAIITVIECISNSCMLTVIIMLVIVPIPVKKALKSDNQRISIKFYVFGGILAAFIACFIGSLDLIIKFVRTPTNRFPFVTLIQIAAAVVGLVANCVLFRKNDIELGTLHDTHGYVKYSRGCFKLTFALSTVFVFQVIKPITNTITVDILFDAVTFVYAVAHTVVFIHPVCTSFIGQTIQQQ